MMRLHAATIERSSIRQFASKRERVEPPSEVRLARVLQRKR